MAEETAQDQPLSGDERPAVSYLVRFWLEPQAAESSSARGYARDLRTGEEHYFRDPLSFSKHIICRLQAGHQAVENRTKTGSEVEEKVG